MTSFMVMIPPDTAAADEAVAAEYVADKFSVYAFILPAVWAIWHRMWIEAAIFIMVAVALASGISVLGGPPGELISTFLGLLVSVFVGLENGALRISALRRRGWAEAGVVDADSAEDAAIRFAAATARDVPATPVELSTASEVEPRREPWGRPTGPALGLLSLPGDR